jgi:hypothetical protein
MASSSTTPAVIAAIAETNDQMKPAEHRFVDDCCGSKAIMLTSGNLINQG